jgi:hypothetical protein
MFPGKLFDTDWVNVNLWNWIGANCLLLLLLQDGKGEEQLIQHN